MFVTGFDARSRTQGRLRRLGTAPLAVAIHAVVLGALAVAQAVDVRPVPEPVQIVSLWTPPAPPRGDDRPRGSGQTKREAPAKTVSGPTVQIHEVTDTSAGPPKETAADDTGGIDSGPGTGTGTADTGKRPPVREEPASRETVVQDRPVRPGPDVVLPVAIERAEPRYPDIARRARVAGVAVLQAVIDRTGSVVDVSVLRDPGLGCGEAAAEAVRMWRYRPATRHGRPIAVILTVTVTFRLS